VNAGTVLGVIGEPGEESAETEAPSDGSTEVEIHPVGEPFKQPAAPRPATPKPAPKGAPNPAPAETDSPLAKPFRPSPPAEKEPASQEIDSPLAAPFKPAASARPAVATPKRDLGFISPVVAKLAQEQNVDLQQLTGTGAGGRITKKDVLDYLAGSHAPTIIEQSAGPQAAEAAEETELPPWEKPGEGDLFRPAELQFADGGPDTGESDSGEPARQAVVESKSPAAALAPQTGDTTIPVEGMRKLIAEHMVRSERTAPHVTTVFEADLSAVLAHMAANKDAFARDGVTLTLTAYFVSAAVAGLQAVPLVNSQWGEDKIVLKREINIGLAVALDQGLIVPVIKHAGEKSLQGLAREVNDLARRARAKALKADEVQGGTFTITNHGVSGSLFATPIINQPQTAILGVGVMQKRVVVIGDAIAIRPMVYLTLTFDHRVLDGAVADRFMSKIKVTLEEWR
jgi:pyruvate/2-oxoglutarate dehydrogenase complex dihydrolipoamide acyltransferase (E2) component